MTDPRIDIKQFAAKEEKAARAWLGSNLVPLALGIAIGLLMGWAICHL